jgi:formate hydrogenlyase subunit 3/multisubunit Na+/H+ antiporter MnhD subunit
MFARMIDDLKESAGLAVKMTSLAAAIAIAIFIMISFLCAAAFVYVLQTYGLVEACLTGAAIFLLVALIAIAVYAIRKRQARRHAAENTKSALRAVLDDPMLVAAGIQVARAIGVRKLVPILALSGLALGLLANRAHSDQAPAE